jgi:hypothetical protein
VATDEDEPTALFVSCHHAREITTPEAALDAAQYLLDNYDGSTTAYVDSNEIWIIPVANPDGYNRVWVEDNLWRKNVRETCVTPPSSDGVDLNRNYPHDWSLCGSGSNMGCSEVYYGPSAASEPETQTMIALNQREHFAVSIDYHSFGEDVLWGYYQEGAPCAQVNMTQLPPIIDTRNALQAAIGFAERGPSASGEHYEWQYNAIGVLAYLLEIDSNAQGFQPLYDQVPGIVAGLRPGIDVILDRIEGPQIRGYIRDGRTGDPISANLSIAEIILSGGEQRFSEPRFGRYQWLLTAGTYNLTASKPGYDPANTQAVVSSTPVERELVLNPQVTPFRLAAGAASGGGSQIRRFTKQ